MQIFRPEQIDTFIQTFESRRKSDEQNIIVSVREIVTAVRTRGDAALAEFARRYDGCDIRNHGFYVSEAELEDAYHALDPDLRQILHEAQENIAKFHAKALPQSWLTWEADQVVLGQKVSALQRVGVYVPGGRAAYPSSLLMGVIPAQVAGVEEIIISTPANRDGQVNPTILAAAHLLGIHRVLRVGGAQAIAAMAYGTETVPRVDKIVGPGNAYVAKAKKMVFGDVGIDMVAGPSEVVIIGDHQANPDYVAADLLAQAEHDPLSSAILLTPSADLATAVAAAVEAQLDTLERREIILESLTNYGAILQTADLQSCIEICNRLAPEHLGLHIQDAWSLLGAIQTAGAIFIGSYSPEAVGDYWAGPNHVLPTNGAGRFLSPLRTEDFLKTSSIVAYSPGAMQRNGNKIIRFAQAEGLTAHAHSIRVRIDSHPDRS